MDSRTRIVEAALRVFAETGYRGATTRRIAQEADVNEVTLFRHFGSKEELIRAALEHTASQEEAQLPAVPQRPYAELTQWAREHYRKLSLRAPIIRTCLGESTEHPEMMERVSEGPVRVGSELRRYFQQLLEHGEASGAVDAEVAASMLMSALFTDAISRDIMPRLYRYPREEAPARYAEFALRALGVVPEGGSGGGVSGNGTQ